MVVGDTSGFDRRGLANQGSARARSRMMKRLEQGRPEAVADDAVTAIGTTVEKEKA